MWGRKSYDDRGVSMSILPLILNIALLVTLSVLQQFILRRWGTRGVTRRALSGVLFGLVAITVMATPLTLAPGVIFDGRSIILGVAGLFGGTLVAGIATAMAAAYRVHLGGAGTLMGVLVILESAALGLIFRQFSKRSPRLMRMVPLWALGLTIHVVMVLLIGTLPGGLGEAAVRQIALPVIALYPLGFLLVCRLIMDQQERAASEDALRQSEERYRAIVHSAPFGMYLYRIEGDDLLFVSANPAAGRMIGYDHHSLEGKRIEDAFPPLVDAGIPAVYRRVAREGGTWHMDSYAYNDGGVEGMFEVTAFHAGTDTVAVTLVDVSEKIRRTEELRRYREELEELVAERTRELEAANTELREANEAKTRFLRAMSHELRTPLNSIIGFSDILRRGMAGPLSAEQDKQIEMINTSGRHLLALINDVLDLSRIEASGLELHMHEFDAVELAGEAMATLQPEATDKGLTFDMSTSVEAIMMTCDRLKVRQILLNLLGNAIKFTETGFVRLSVRSAPGLVSFAVADSGPGIVPERQERIFGEFVQAEDDDAPREGTGLGLAISRGLTSALGGMLQLESTPGIGSTFTLTLPDIPMVDEYIAEAGDAE
jgi:PAS domain S-box-containing protein